MELFHAKIYKKFNLFCKIFDKIFIIEDKLKAKKTIVKNKNILRQAKI